MSSRRNDKPKAATSDPPKCLPAYVVAFSFNENDVNKTKAEPFSETLNIDNKTDLQINNENTLNSDTFKNISVIINEVINKVTDIYIEEEMKNVNEINNLEINYEAKNFFNIPSNSNSTFQDISSSTPSTDTIRNHSDTSTDTICSNIGSHLFENAAVSNTTLKDPSNYEELISNVNLSSVVLLSNKNSSVKNDKENQMDDLEKPYTNEMAMDSLPKIDQSNELSETNLKKIMSMNDSQNVVISKSNNSLTLERDFTVPPFKIDVVNVSLAQMGNPAIIANKEMISFNENQLSTSTLMNDLTDSLNVRNESNLLADNSDVTLIGSVISGLSSRDDILLANTGSGVNKTDESEYSFTSLSEYCSSTDGKDEQIFPLKNNNTVIITNVLPSTSNVNQYNIPTNNILLSDEINKLYPLRSKGDNQSLDEFPKNIFKKSYNVDRRENFQKSISLPNEATIKEIMADDEYSQKISCSEESRNFQPFPGMWDKLTVTLDLAIKRLEESLCDKILNELSNTLQKLEHFANRISNQTTKESLSDLNTIEIVAESKNDEAMQCNLTESYVIDNLKFKLSKEVHSERNAITKQLKIKHPKVFKDTFEVLKAYSQAVAIPIGDDDSLKLSEQVSSSSETRSRVLFRGPLRFLRENTVVLGSVPAFFVYMLLIYGLVVLIVKF